MTKKHTWLALLVTVPGLIILVVVGLYVAAASTPPIHPTEEGVSVVMQAAPPAEWAARAENARAIARAGLVEQNLPALSVAVGVGDTVVWAESFGWADIENKVPATPATRFRIGTASMVLTSAGAGLMIENGQLKLDEKIQAYVPDFTEKQWPVTVRQLLSHIGGVRPDEGDEEPVHVRCDETIEGVRRFAKDKLIYEPGTDYRFTTYGGMLVSAAIDAVAGEPFFTYMRKQVFEPLGMTHTNADGEPAKDRAVYYFPKFAANTRYGPQEPDEEDFTCFSGAAAFLSTASDMVRFGLAIKGGKFLKPETLQMMQTPQHTASGKDTGYGLGWDLEDAQLAGEPVVVVGHDGELRGGMVASFMTFKDRDLVVAVLSNTSFADTYHLGLKIAEAFVAKGKGPS
jgi:serine beta-lactamase-like protein LACTB, mitochondrial